MEVSFVNRRRHSEAKAIGEALSELVEHLGIKSKIQEYDAVVRWESIVGPQIAKVATAKSIQKGLLIIRVSNGPWRHELSIRKREIIEKLNSALGHDVVKDIRFV